MEEGGSILDAVTYQPLKVLVDRTPGLQAAIVSDLEGGLVAQAIRDGCGEEVVSRAGSMEVASIAAEQAEKMQMGRTRNIVTYHDQHIAVYFISPLLIVKMVAEKIANVGIILATSEEVDAITSELVGILRESQDSTDNRVFES